MSDTNTQWWCTTLSDHLIWARLRVLESGVAEVFGADGETLRYDDEATARMSLLDAEFRAFDGLDEDDAAMLGFHLLDAKPPAGADDIDLLQRMTQKIIAGNA